jgi:hypothetical protein
MITLEQTVNIPASREVRFHVSLPETTPTGAAQVVLVFKTPYSTSGQPAEKRRTGLLAYPATRDEALVEAERKFARRFADGTDGLQKYCGCLAHIYPEDGAVEQRRMHTEWDRDWDK